MIFYLGEQKQDKTQKITLNQKKKCIPFLGSVAQEVSTKKVHLWTRLASDIIDLIVFYYNNNWVIA